jgi:S1-C subfamily serine protease
MMTRLRAFLLMLIAVCVITSFSLGALQVVVLNDGTTYTGEVRRMSSGQSYTIVLADGTRKIIKASDIRTIDGKPLDGAAPASDAGGADTGGANTGGNTVTGNAGFMSAKSRADRVQDAIAAVTIWEKFVNENPNSPDIEQAKTELAMWQARYKDGAEKVKNKWLTGKEVKELREKVQKIVETGVRFEADDQITKAMKSYEEALALYPRHFLANFRFGYLILFRNRLSDYDKAIRALETARSVDATGPEVWANLAAIYSIRKRHVEAIKAAEKALNILNDPELVNQFQAVFGNAPRGIYNNNREVRDIVDGLGPVIGNVQGGGGGGNLIYFSPGYFDAKRAEKGKPPVDTNSKDRTGVLGNGSGFFVTADGYAITNRHVVTDDDKKVDPTVVFRVRLDNGDEYPARLVAVDEEYDVALIKVDQPDKTFDYLRVADDNPDPASNVLVLGYPATSMYEAADYSMQVDPGTVKSVHPSDKEYQVWFDLSTTHGNSGGPIVDMEGRVVGILSAGRTVYNVTYVLGVGPNQIEEFLGRNKEKSPNLDYQRASETPPAWDAVRLQKQCRKATLLVLIVRPEAGKDQTGGSTTQPTTKPAEGESKK